MKLQKARQITGSRPLVIKPQTWLLVLFLFIAAFIGGLIVVWGAGGQTLAKEHEEQRNGGSTAMVSMLLGFILVGRIAHAVSECGWRQDRYGEHVRQNQQILVAGDQRVSLRAHRQF